MASTVAMTIESVHIQTARAMRRSCHQRFLARRARRAAFRSLGSIVSATSRTLVVLRYSSCFACCAIQRHPGGHGPSSAQCPNPNEQWHSVTGSSNAMQRSYSDTCSPGRASQTPPPTPRWVLTSFFRASVLMTLPSVGREIPVSSTSSGICKPSAPARSIRPIEIAAIATCREIISSFRLRAPKAPTAVRSAYTGVNKRQGFWAEPWNTCKDAMLCMYSRLPACLAAGAGSPRGRAERNKP